ncbi:MAG: hypothetical protein HKP48_00515 [Winogradskyella sp.]|uniref:hypothetical protein n=1 Tax=Winogradskyella sp. TaxID=1883156 RepID=UPI00178DDE5C|nr:hypothetical protein [Winogradskyella sp.]MBT8244840.1 hypothetical protein [Winogradskyella sp.]NNK21798.1 hypothetical protein [Winogradskyella sp.]
MRKVLILICLLLTTATVTAQFGRRGANQVRRPQTSSEPTEAQKAKFEKNMKERQQEFITKIINKLGADEFQKEITRITLTEYFDKLIAFNQIEFDRQIGKKDALRKLQKEHFSDLRSLLSEVDMNIIDDVVEGKNLKSLDEEGDSKKKRKRKKNNKKDKG